MNRRLSWGLASLLFVWCWSATVLAAGATDAAKWLTQNQATNGAWSASSNSAAPLTTTSAVVEALVSNGSGSANITKALTYLQQQKPASADTLARRLIAFGVANKPAPSSDLAALLKLQNKDGGFAPLAGRQSTVLDTVLALLALEASRNTKLKAAQQAISFLVRKQRTNGGWGFFDATNDASPYLSGFTLLAISRYQQLYNLKSVLQKASTFLTGKQAADGSFAKGSDAVLTSSLAALGLAEASPSNNVAVGKTIAWLLKQQASDGSFVSKDTYATAYALRVLDTQKADLVVKASEITVTPQRPIFGSSVSFEAVLRNTGTRNAGSFVVGLYKGSPSAGGTRIAQSTVSRLDIGKSTKVTLTWPKAGPLGTNYIYIAVDTGKTVKEISERNNEAVIGLPVVAPVDLSVSPKFIVLKPVFPSPGKKVEFSAVVLNSGGIEAKNVEVGFYNGDPKSGGKLFAPLQTIPSIGPGKNQQIRVTSAAALSQASYTLYVVVDPNNKTKDQNRSNNVTTKTFAVRPRVDLVVNSQGIFLSKENATEGDDVQIRIGVYNAEAAEAKDVVVRIYDGDPKNKGVQIGTDLKVTVPGYKAVYTTPVTYKTFGKTGSRLIYVVVDPDKKQPDIRAENNSAIRILRVAGLPDYSLSVAEVYYSPSRPSEGTQQRISFRVRNKGIVNATINTTLHVYDQDPATAGAKPVSTINVGRVNAGTYTNAVFYWNPDKLGAKSFWAVADATKQLKERDETNNQVKITFIVAPANYPDLSIVANDFVVTPSAPQAGDTLNFRATLRNLVSRAASNIEVVFYRDGTGTANKIGSVTVANVAGNNSALATFSWKSPNDITRGTFYVRIDPSNRVRELSTGNNQQSRTLTFTLSRSATPSNFKVTASGSSSLQTSWTPGSASAAVGINGYRVYCNGGLMNPPTWINKSTVTATSVYSTSSTYKASNANDGNYSTYWYPTRTNTNPQTLTFKFAQATQIAGFLTYFTSTGSRSYKVEALVSGSWQTVYTRSAGGYYHEHYFKPVTTDQMRFVFDAKYRSYSYLGVREVRWFEPKLLTGTSHTFTGIAPASYKCHVVAEKNLKQQTPASNDDTATLGDTKAPGAPTNLKVTYSGSSYNATITWNAPFDSDLMGFRVYTNQGVNVAHWGREASVTLSGGGSNYYPERVIDGTRTSYAYITAPSYYQIKLAKAYTLTSIGVGLYSSYKSAYRVEASLDGKTYTTLIKVPSHSGFLKSKLTNAFKAQYLRLIPEAPNNTRIYIGSFEAYTSDYAPLSLHSVSYLNTGLGTHDSGNSYWNNGWRYDYKPRSSALRRFVSSYGDFRPFEVLYTKDLDLNRTLDRISGRYNGRFGPWARTNNVRFEYMPHRTTRFGGFRILAALSYGFQSTTTYTQTGLYRSGSIGYAVTSVDRSGNESALSTPTTANINDTTAPATPSRVTAKSGNAKVDLTWYVVSTRSEPDRAGIRLYRDGKLLTTLGASITRYTDKGLTNGQTYSYELSTIDVNGNESKKSAPVKATPSAIDFNIAQSGVFADFFVMPRDPSVYDSAILAVIARNIGQQDAPAGVEIDFYDGDPTKGGTKIGSIALKEPLPAGGKVIGTYTWQLKNVKPGKRTIYAVMDPNKKFPELNENNNTASRELTIHADPYLQTNVNQVDGSKFPDVCAFLRVRDGSGGGLFGLDERNFVVCEDKVRQQPIKVTQLTQNQKGLPKVDVTFVIDTSGSMNNEWQTVCAVVRDIGDLLLASRVDVKITIYALGTKYQCGTALTTGIYQGKPRRAGSEDWGPGSVWVMLNHQWRADASRILIPISDEGSLGGGSWASDDAASGAEMSKTALSTTPKTILFPFWGTEIGGVNSTNAIANGMRKMAKETGGKAFPFLNATQVVQEIVNAALNSVSDYKICYKTNNTAKDGSLRKVKVDTNYNVSKGTSEGEYTAPRDNLPDLLFVDGLKIVPASPVPGQSSTIKATIRNVGGKPAVNVEVRITLGNFPLSTRTIPLLAPGQRLEVTLPWQALPGISKLTITADPANKIVEVNENNNQAVLNLTLPGNRGIELAVTSSDLSIDPKDAKRGLPAKLNARVHNIGNQDASQVLVAFYEGDPTKGGVALDATVVPAIAKGQSVIASITHIPAKAGPLDLYVVVDPYDKIPDDLQANNTAHRVFDIGQKGVTLTVSTDKPSYPSKTDVKIDVAVQNNTAKAWTGRGEVWIEDSNDKPVTKVADFQANAIPTSGLAGWPYRLPVTWTVPTGGTKHLFLGVKVNFTTALTDVGAGGKAFDPASIRVMLFDKAGNAVKQLPYRFQPAKNFNALSQASGELVVFLKDAQSAGDKVQLMIFFDQVQTQPKPKSAAAPDFPKAGWQLVYGEDSGRMYTRQRKPDGTLDKEIYIGDTGSYSVDNRTVIVGDFDKDGTNDLVAASLRDRRLYFYPGTRGAAPFDATKRKSIGSVTSSEVHISGVTGDFNNDGNLDFVSSGYYYLYVYLGKGDGTFTTRSYYRYFGTGRGRAKAVTDVDGDGKLDILVATNNPGALYWLKGSGTGTFSRGVVFLKVEVTDPYGMVYDDINGDGKKDILIHQGETSGLTLLYPGLGSNKFGPKQEVASLKFANYLVFAGADWDYDGKIDIFAGTYTSRLINYYKNNGNGSFAKAVKLNTAAYNYLTIAVGPPTAQLYATVGKALKQPERRYNFTWNTGTTPAGPYKVRVKLLEGQHTINDGVANFTITPDIKARAELTSDKIAYPASTPVLLMSRIFNEGSNHTFDSVQATIQIDDAQGKKVDTLSFTEQQLLPSKFRDHTSTWNSGTRAPGKYTATLKVMYKGKEVATAKVSFDILSSAQSGIGLIGSLKVSPNLAKPGDKLDFTYDVTNVGNQKLTDQELKMVVYADSDRKEKGVLTRKVTIEIQKNATGTAAFDTKGLTGGDYTVLLTTKFGTSEVALDVASFKLQKVITRPPLTVKIKTPQTGAALGSPVVNVVGDVSDGDAEVTIGSVKAQVTGQSAQAASFTLDQYNLNTCQATIEASAKRGSDTAKDSVQVQLDINAVVLQRGASFYTKQKSPTAIAVGKNSLLFSDAKAGTVTRLEYDASRKVTKETEVAKGLTSPGALLEDSGGVLYVAQYTDDSVVRVTGGKATAVIEAKDGLLKPAALAFDGTGGLFVASEGNGKIFLVDANGKVTTYSDKFQDPAGLVYDSGKKLLYVLDRKDGNLYSVSGPGQAQPTQVAGAVAGRATGLTRVGNWLVLSDADNNLIALANPRNGKLQPIAGGFPKAGSIVGVGSNGFFIATDGAGIAYGELQRLSCRPEEPEPSEEPEPEPIAEQTEGGDGLGDGGDGGNNEPSTEARPEENTGAELNKTDASSEKPEILIKEIAAEAGYKREANNPEGAAPGGCGCQTDAGPASMTLFFFLMAFFLPLAFRRRKR